MGWVEAVCDAAGQDASFQNKAHLALGAAGFGGKVGKGEG